MLGSLAFCPAAFNVASCMHYKENVSRGVAWDLCIGHIIKPQHDQRCADPVQNLTHYIQQQASHH